MSVGGLGGGVGVLGAEAPSRRPGVGTYEGVGIVGHGDVVWNTSKRPQKPEYRHSILDIGRGQVGIYSIKTTGVPLVKTSVVDIIGRCQLPDWYFR